ncbi:MAG: CapA family protein [Myxococcales bacterium]|nr:CapA family protein [Myxococcales bacterium]
MTPDVDLGPPPDPAPIEITLSAVGDVLPHRKVKATAAEKGWDWIFAEAAPLLGTTDLAFANLESPVAPDVKERVHDEVFDAPAEMLAGLATAGVDVVSMANNHAFDQRPEGIVETWTRVRDAGLHPVGAGPNEVEARSPYVAEVNGVRVAFLALADLSNIDGNTGPEAPNVFFAGDKHCDGLCEGIDRDAVHYSLDEDRILGAVRTAEAMADVIVVSFHWGNEYRDAPLPEYPALAHRLVEAGVDVILGHHPHVLQPIERVERSDGTHAVIAYSLGNFVSNMQNARTRDSIVLRLVVTRTADGLVDVGDPEVTRLWTENTDGGIRVRTHASLRAQAEAEGDESRLLLVERRKEAIDRVITARP